MFTWLKKDPIVVVHAVADGQPPSLTDPTFVESSLSAFVAAYPGGADEWERYMPIWTAQARRFVRHAAFSVAYNAAAQAKLDEKLRARAAADRRRWEKAEAAAAELAAQGITTAVTRGPPPPPRPR